jgi:hypothetical protein
MKATGMVVGRDGQYWSMSLSHGQPLLHRHMSSSVSEHVFGRIGQKISRHVVKRTALKMRDNTRSGCGTLRGKRSGMGTIMAAAHSRSVAFMNEQPFSAASTDSMLKR